MLSFVIAGEFERLLGLRLLLLGLLLLKGCCSVPMSAAMTQALEHSGSARTGAYLRSAMLGCTNL